MINHLRQFLSGRTIVGTEVAKRNPMANYNCSFLVIDDISCFYELTYLLMIGTGVGLRIKKEDVDKLRQCGTTITLYIKNTLQEQRLKG